MLKHYSWYYIASCILLLLQSCKSLTDPGEIEYKNSILFNLRTGNSLQQIFVYNTYPLNHAFESPPPFFNKDEAFAANAAIIISDENNIYNDFQISYVDTISKSRCYSNKNEMFVYPNKVYSIKVSSNGQLISGNILTMGDFEITDVNETVSSDDRVINYKVTWSKCLAARYYILNSIYYHKDSVIIGSSDGKLIWGFANIKSVNSKFMDADTLSGTNIISQQIALSSKSDSASIEVCAYDINSYNHIYKGIKKVGVENAYGYLGSSTIKTIKVKLK